VSTRPARTTGPGRSRALLVCLAATLFLGVPGTAEGGESDGQALAVIVHPAVLEADVSRDALRQIFLGEQQFWSGNQRITLFLHPTGTVERAAVLRQLYRMGETEFKRYWVAKLFRAEVTAGPKIVSGNDAILRLVATVPGAVAMIPANEVDARVRVLRVNGVLPGEPNYPFRVGARR
jgi:hypothetical protein